MNDMRDHDDEFESAEDRRLSALLGATHAPANPAVWQRVRAELAATVRPVRARGFDAVLAWFTRPVALAAATAALVVSLGAGYGLLDTLAPTAAEDGGTVAYDSATLMESLLDDTASGAADEGDGDAPTDSGGQS